MSLPRVFVQALRSEHLPELADLLRHPEVYEHLGGMPTLEDFVLDRERALQGPSASSPDEHWLNYLVRERATSQMIGRLEATVHDSLAEVAFLFCPSSWGKGLAHESLAWLHDEVSTSFGIVSFWATTVPGNERCQALLRRSGYTQVDAGAPRLHSFEKGDLVFHLRRSA